MPETGFSRAGGRENPTHHHLLSISWADLTSLGKDWEGGLTNGLGLEGISPMIL